MIVGLCRVPFCYFIICNHLDLMNVAINCLAHFVLYGLIISCSSKLFRSSVTILSGTVLQFFNKFQGSFYHPRG